MALKILMIAAVAGLGLTACEQSSTPDSSKPHTAPATTPQTSVPSTSGLANPDRNRPAVDRSSDSAVVHDNLSNPAKAADNTAQNAPDRHPDETKTPEDQSNATTNIELTAEIRRAVMADKSLSMNAKNCKIIADANGSVTLRGVVNSQTEKDLVESYARNSSGVTWLDNQLEVKSR